MNRDRAEMLEAIQRQHDDDQAQRYEEYLEQQACESIAAEESKWVGIMAARPTDGTWDVPDLPHRGIDSRLHGP